MRIAVWQARGPDAGSARLVAAVARAAAAGADVLVTPELLATGYGAPFGGPDPDLLPHVQGAAATHGIAVVVSEPHDGRITAAVVGPDGALLGRYAKTHLWGDDERAAFTPGDGSPLLVDLAGERCAVLICYDVEFPEAVRSLALAGARTVLVPTALDDPAVARLLVPARAMENGVAIAYANQCGGPFCGASVIVGPDGAQLARAGEQEDLLVADVVRPAGLTDYLGDRRPEVYRLGRPERRETSW